MSSLSEKLKVKRAAQGINPPDAAKPDTVVPYAPPAPETMKGAEDQNPFTALVTKVLEVSAGAPKTLPAASDNTTPVLRLYIDCRPDEFQGLSLAAEIERRTPTVVAAVRAREPNAVPSECVDVREIKFGAGTTAMVSDFKRNPPSGSVFASAVGLSAQVVEVLIPLATQVIRTVR